MFCIIIIKILFKCYDLTVKNLATLWLPLFALLVSLKYFANINSSTSLSINIFNNFEFDIGGKNPDSEEEFKAREHFYCIVATKQRPLDIK